MDTAEKARMRREILDEVGALLREQLAADEWGRVLVEVVRGPDGAAVVAGVDVEEIVGDEGRVDAAFGAEGVRGLLPLLASASEALCAIEDVDLDDVRGGTFLRRAAGGFEWLPGLVHVPSPALDEGRDALTRGLQARSRALEERFHLADHERYELDVASERIVFSTRGEPRVVARATLLGTWSRASRAWAWGGYNRSVPEPARRASAALVDEVLDRDVWELSTPVFALDEPTAWLLCAFVCERAGGEGVHAARSDEGIVFTVLRDVRELPARAS